MKPPEGKTNPRAKVRTPTARRVRPLRNYLYAKKAVETDPRGGLIASGANRLMV
jgi:hypothetical protein